MEIKFCCHHFSRHRILKNNLSTIICHVLHSLSDLSVASTSKCCFLFLDLSPSGKSFIFSVYFCLFVCLKQRSKESLSEELVNMFQCTNTSKYSCVLIRLASIPGSGLWHIWQFILQLLDSHCGQTEGELIL